MRRSSMTEGVQLTVLRSSGGAGGRTLNPRPEAIEHRVSPCGRPGDGVGRERSLGHLVGDHPCQLGVDLNVELESVHVVVDAKACSITELLVDRRTAPGGNV